MLKELSEDLMSVKQIQSETKDTLIEIKNNSQGNNRACAPSGQLQTTSEHHHPVPASLILQRVEAGDQWSQPVLAADWPV